MQLLDILMLLVQMIGAYCFCPVCLSGCMSVVNFNLKSLCYKFFTIIHKILHILSYMYDWVRSLPFAQWKSLFCI